jgi:hypothetical protein
VEHYAQEQQQHKNGGADGTNSHPNNQHEKRNVNAQLNTGDPRDGN